MLCEQIFCKQIPFHLPSPMQNIINTGCSECSIVLYIIFKHQLSYIPLDVIEYMLYS